jgi:DNA-binding GntR family transcriptional regulator
MEQLICRTPLLALARTGRIAYCGAEEHREVVEALARRDAAAAVRRMNEHLGNVERQLGGDVVPEKPPTLAAVFAS